MRRHDPARSGSDRTAAQSADRADRAGFRRRGGLRRHRRARSRRRAGHQRPAAEAWTAELPPEQRARRLLRPDARPRRRRPRHRLRRRPSASRQPHGPAARGRPARLPRTRLRGLRRRREPVAVPVAGRCGIHSLRRRGLGRRRGRGGTTAPRAGRRRGQGAGVRGGAGGRTAGRSRGRCAKRGVAEAYPRRTTMSSLLSSLPIRQTSWPPSVSSP